MGRRQGSVFDVFKLKTETVGKSYTIKVDNSPIAVIIYDGTLNILEETLLNTDTQVTSEVVSDMNLEDSGLYEYTGIFTDEMSSIIVTVNFVIHQFIKDPDPLPAEEIEAISNEVPRVIVSESKIEIKIPDNLLNVGSIEVKSQKRSLFLSKLFEDNVGLEQSSAKITILKEQLFGGDSEIEQPIIVIKKASNTEVPQNLSQLVVDEVLYMYMGINDFTILTTNN